MRKSKKRVGLAALVLSMCLVLLPMSSVVAATTIVLVNPPSQSVNVDGTVTVQIKVDSVTSLYGVDIRVTFDAAKLQAQDADANAANGVQIAPGSFLDPAQGFLAQNTVNNSTGQVQYVFALMSPATAVSGTGVLATITFKAKAAGVAAITLTSVTLSSDQAQPIAKTLMSGSVTVLPTGAPTATPTTPPSGTPTATPTPYPGVSFPYVVQWGDTLYGISAKFGVTVNAIVAANGLANPNLIYVGQVLTIPGGTTPPSPGGAYVVLAGDNLFRIGLKYGVLWQAIAAANYIMPPWKIYVGQVLVIPGGVPTPPVGGTHVVKAGDTLTAIAATYGVTMWSIVILNNIPNPNLIYVGQVLLIP